MRTVTKNVYYCDHCRKHGLSGRAMEQHERLCTLNPERECRWRFDGDHASVDTRALADAMHERAPLSADDIAWLHDEVDGCPACMLAALRQSGVEYHYDERSERLWDYTEEVERFRAAEREELAQRHLADEVW